ncbi:MULTISPECIES: acetoacetate decarboxylase family protein [Mycobacterium]|uniref:Acetoacetate decarboxylase n=1 Tax=Mycobacterium syngnathidarum TaxID=1908205 RepID=A0A1S1JX02_9MYCO|nr:MULTISPECIES: acetoacetate decarboxylase family protein [Mycobacterium]MCG7608158.1 acetoacetate decarboxylase family protein [Mycobacterium sp. CnD-18-1]OHT93432.1 acetoacetate decarboxylase [Mycobacterium syngnathidarum]OLT93226.1 acetoacetate decarboxylase [Mycobacterium syngnathidarum]
MPVQIRTAEQHMAMFSVDADAAQRMIDYSGMRVYRHRPHRAIVVLMLMRYIDGDLGPYLEYGTNVMVNRPGAEGSGLRGMGSAGALVHHLPVDGEFTLQAGRQIWGYPKVLADFTVHEGKPYGFEVKIDGRLAVGMEFKPGLPVPSALTAKPQVQSTFSCLDGVLRETEGQMRLSGVRYRPGGARIRLGDHPYAAELAELGLPKRAMLSSSARNVQMTFADAKEIS